MAPRDWGLLVAGGWLATGRWEEVRSPYDGALVGRVATADEALVDLAVEAARGALEGDAFPQHERAAVLERASRLLAEQTEDLAALIALEGGKPIRSARAEVERSASTLLFSAVEARKLGGEGVAMDASAAGSGKVGLVKRIPLGVVAAISSFNFPLNLVVHKVGPAIAAGNAVILKPADRTPITSLRLAEILLEAGLPEGWISVLPGPGSSVGNSLVEHEQTAAVTFTGSTTVGWAIRAKVPHKKVNLELGSNAPLIVNWDGDWRGAADKAAVHAFSNAGQSCISIQRILIHEDLADRFVERLVTKTEALSVGDPLDEETDVGPLISLRERDRVLTWIDEAVREGAELLTGGRLVDEGRCVAPTLLRTPAKSSKVWREEIFGPVATVDPFRDLDHAMALANDSRFGLQAGIFTRDIGTALTAGDALEFGGVVVNDVPTFRADQQPYGGVKESGNTREGPAYAIRELTEERLITLQG